MPANVRRALIAADSFKGTLSSAEVGEALAAGLADRGVASTVLRVGDGGEGTAVALRAALGGEAHTARARDSLGNRIEAGWMKLGDGRAVVEVASASGLGLVSELERDPWAADTYGTGELIAAAAQAGCEPVLVAAGGSATTEGGAGALRALEEAGVEPEIEVLCDVRTPWERAAIVFGPQKGADAATVARLSERLERMGAQAPKDPRGVAMSGCAGGLAGGLWAHRGARLLPGAEFVLDAAGFDRLVPTHDLVLTGEGRLDESTGEGKLVAEVARRAAAAGAACHAIVGSCVLAAEQISALGIASVHLGGMPEEIRAAAAGLAGARFGTADGG